ncbi:klarsicht protein isoform X2 [Drosophila bipectinata]|uniref:klarsicht protein isoform X2 n=1 Tax=Drosophila bipectinata TaxID=42026 RepID=UPI0038B3B459
METETMEIEIEIKNEKNSDKEIAMITNQETENAAIITGGDEGSATRDNTTKLDGTFAIPVTPPNKAGSRSSSLKKQNRISNGSGMEREGKARRSSENFLKSDLLKQSHSMMSLQAPSEEHLERRNVVQAKIHLERPYHSLKKNSQSGSSNKMHRYSWGSGHSSSNSLHSNATLGLGSSGKDDLWAAIQTNYNYIMDTNLLDTCKEARCEIEGAAAVLEMSREGCVKMTDETQPKGFSEDPKELRRWLREMENKLESSPTISELTLFGNADLQRHLAVHSVLYHEIVSHARVVSSCIRAAEKEHQLQLQQLQLQKQHPKLSSQQPASLTSNCSSESTSESGTKSSSLSSGFVSDVSEVNTSITAIAIKSTQPPSHSHHQHHPPKKGDGNLERLRDRYHLLYLKAFELQLCLDNLLRKRSSRSNGLDDDDENEQEDTEDDSFGYEEEACQDEATEDDSNDLNSDLDLENPDLKSSSPVEFILQRCQITATQIDCQPPTSPARASPSQKEPLPTDQPRDCLAPQKTLKSADVSTDDDEEGWLYTATATTRRTAPAVDTEDTGAGASETAKTSIVDDLQPMNIFSTTETGGKLLLPTGEDNDDDDVDFHKEKKVLATFAASQASHSYSSNYESSSACSSSNSNSNGRLTETSATSRVTQMQVHAVADLHPKMQREFQTHGNRSDATNSRTGTATNNNNLYSSNMQQNTTERPEELGRKILDEITVDMANGNTSDPHQIIKKGYSPEDACNISVSSIKEPADCHLLSRNPEKSATATSTKSPASSNNATISASMMIVSSIKGKASHDAIKQLVMEAEHLVRDTQEVPLMTPTKPKHSIVKISSTVKKREVALSHPIKQRVEEWLEHQPSTPQLLATSHSHTHELVPRRKPDGCEASGETSETDSVPHTGGAAGGGLNGPGSDTSEGFTDSIATCMQRSTNSFGTSMERIGGSEEPIEQTVSNVCNESSNQSLNGKVVKRPQTRRKSDRPWSVSCLSQLATDTSQLTSSRTADNSSPGWASHSISESALDSLSPGPRPRAASSSGTGSNTARKADSKGSLRRRKARKKRSFAISAGRKSDSGSELGGDLTQTLIKSCESMSSQQLQEFTNALLSIQKGASVAPLHPKAEATLDSGHAKGKFGESQLMLPKFRVGSLTTAGLIASDTRLGALAALSNYMNENEQQAELSTEDHHSSISETAWDNYQEKYNSENYSEGFDSDAARRLLEFGDDYRNFIDSQSDCCSSLSATNNLDSFSPPRMDSLQKREIKVSHITQEAISNCVDHARRQRTLDIQYERRRKTLEVRRKSCQDMDKTPSTQAKVPSQPTLSVSTTALITTPKNQSSQKLNQWAEAVGRKLEFGGMSHSAQSLLRRTSESDTSTRRRRTYTADDRRRSSRNLENGIKPILTPASSSSCSDSEDGEQEIRSLLLQSRDRLEDTKALKIRCHLLRPEDYNEIINTCRDNIHCLEAVLRGPPGTVISNHCADHTKDLLSAWGDLLAWTENASEARRLQHEMNTLKNTLQRLGDNSSPNLLDTEPAIQIAVELLESEKTQLASYRTNMLQLNASVHSWLTRQERRLQKTLEEEQQESEHQAEKPSTPLELESKEAVAITVTDSNGNQVEAVSAEKSTKSTGTKAWDVLSLASAEKEFHKHLKGEVSDMYSAWDEANSRINSQLELLTNSLIAWRQLESGLSEFHLALGQDRGTLKGLEGALDKGQQTSIELAQNVKLVAKLLSEKVHVGQEKAVHQHLDPNFIYQISKFKASNGSLSDSGISDGGATSDGGLSERERRLGVLRRLAKQLELALAPGSEAMRSIAIQMENAEAELKYLQNTCRDLIVRTAATHHERQQPASQQNEVHQAKVNEKVPKKTTTSNSQPSSPGKRGKNSRKPQKSKGLREGPVKSRNNSGKDKTPQVNETNNTSCVGEGDSTDDQSLLIKLESSKDDDDSESNNSVSLPRGWAWRIARAAVPMQVALFTIFCAACLMQPNCCDNLNNLSMSFTPQLRYIRGPPPM